jgi:hypothetical protein
MMPPSMAAVMKVANWSARFASTLLATSLAQKASISIWYASRQAALMRSDVVAVSMATAVNGLPAANPLASTLSAMIRMKSRTACAG